MLCCSQPTEVTKDCRVLPAPQHTHTPATVTSSLPSRIFWRLACPWIRLFFVCLGCLVALSLWNVCLVLQGEPPAAMDQAALQRLTLARSSGTLCWTARGAREQQSLRTWIVSFFFGLDGIQLAHSVGEWSLFWIPRLNPLAANCNALQALYWDEDTRETQWRTWLVAEVTYLALCDRPCHSHGAAPAGLAAQ